MSALLQGLANGDDVSSRQVLDFEKEFLKKYQKDNLETVAGRQGAQNRRSWQNQIGSAYSSSKMLSALPTPQFSIATSTAQMVQASLIPDCNLEWCMHPSSTEEPCRNPKKTTCTPLCDSLVLARSGFPKVGRSFVCSCRSLSTMPQGFSSH